MVNDKDNDITTALYYAALGKVVQNYIGRVHPTILQEAMENRAVQTLEAIRCVLENSRLSDMECCGRIENLIRLFDQEVGIKINRHNESDEE